MPVVAVVSAISMPLVSMPIAHVCPVEVMRRETTAAIGMFAAFGIVAMVTVAWIEVIIDMSMKVPRPVEPRSGANKDTSAKPLRAVIPIRRTVVRRKRIVAIRANGSGTNMDINLGRCY